MISKKKLRLHFEASVRRAEIWIRVIPNESQFSQGYARRMAEYHLLTAHSIYTTLMEVN